MGEAVFLRPGEGESIAAGLATLTLKATAETTDGTLSVSETTIEAGFPGPPGHLHRQLHDMFYVLEGTLTVQLGEETREAPPGTFVCVPPGVVHTFSNPGDQPVRFLNFNTPAGFEAYLRDLGAAFAAGGMPTPEQFGRIASRYDIELA